METALSCGGYPFDIQTRIQKIKQIIKSWNKDLNENIHKTIEELEDKVAELEDINCCGRDFELAKLGLEEI